MNRNTLLGVVGAAALAVAGIALVDEGAEVLAGITIGSPPARPAINQFEVVGVHTSPATLSASVQIRSTATVHRTESVTVEAGQCIGLRYTASGGEVERYTRTDPSITVEAARLAFVGANYRAAANALEVWLQGGGRACLPQ